jgi:hypothetical protein
MVNSAVLDVVIGMVFCFASVALIASYLYETGSSLLGLRATSLLKGIKAMLNDPNLEGVALSIYNSALVNPRHDGTTPARQRPKILPSYIVSRDFADALLEHLQSVPEKATNLEKAINDISDPQLKQLLQGMYKRAGQKIEGLQAEISRWFDGSMKRVSGAYKRRAQLYTFLIALALAVGLNIDAFHLFQILWNHPTLLAQATSAGAQVTVGQAAGALADLPVGWGQGFSISWVACLGWLMTASTAIFGAPFWFDLLRRLSNIRGSGQSPNENKDPDPRPAAAKPAAEPQIPALP